MCARARALTCNTRHACRLCSRRRYFIVSANATDFHNARCKFTGFHNPTKRKSVAASRSFPAFSLFFPFFILLVLWFSLYSTFSLFFSFSSFSLLSGSPCSLRSLCSSEFPFSSFSWFSLYSTFSLFSLFFPFSSFSLLSSTPCS